MKIGVDATCWNLGRGYGRHARCLLQALVESDEHNQYTFFTDAAPEHNFPPGARVVKMSTSATTIEAAAEGRSRSLKDLWLVSWTLGQSHQDVLLFPTDFSYVPVVSQARKVVIFHDATAQLFPDLVFGSWKARLLWRLKVWLARWQADRMLTVSEHSRRGLVTSLGLSPNAFEVVGEAPDPIFRPLENSQHPGFLPADRRFLLYVGGFGPLKNLPRLVTVFTRVAKRFPQVDLVLVGEDQGETFYSTVRQLKSQIARAGLERRVHFTGFIEDELLLRLYNHADALVLTSLNEGFGLPALEAAACGCPVVATRSSPLPEILKRGGLFVEPTCEAEIGRALETVLSDQNRRREMGRAALAEAGELSWQTSARKLLSILESLG